MATLIIAATGAKFPLGETVITANAHRALLAFELSDDAENGGGLLGRRDGSTFIVEDVCGNGGRERARGLHVYRPRVPRTTSTRTSSRRAWHMAFASEPRRGQALAERSSDVERMARGRPASASSHDLDARKRLARQAARLEVSRVPRIA